MSALAWGVCCAIAIVFFTLALWLRLQVNRFTLAEKSSRPGALREAKLVYMEKLFRISRPVGLVAKIDRPIGRPRG
jgi:CRISPR-associated exonuclease Cas4